MPRPPFAAVSYTLLAASFPAAQSPIAIAQAPAPAPEHLLAAFDQTAGWLVALDLPAAAERVFETEIFLDGATRKAVLAPFSVRADEFQLLVQGPDGTVAPAEPPPPATVRGFVQGFPESWIAGSLVAGELSALVRLRAGDTLLGIEPARAADPGAPHGLHLVFDEATAAVPPTRCGVGGHALSRPGGSSAAASDGDPGTKYALIACDADVQFFNLNGSSVTNTTHDIENVLNGVDAIYDAQVDVRYEIGTILVRTVEPDPYTTNSPSPLLGELKTAWLSATPPVPRDVTHLFTGKNLSGSTIGIAYLNGVCSLGSGYGLSQSKYTSSLAHRVALSAHEIGHNFGANHCDGTPDCGIMCSWLGGCAGSVTTFGSVPKAEILETKAFATCLSGPPPTAAPVLLSANPPAVPAFGATPITVTGTGLEWVDEVVLGGVALPSPGGFLAVSDSELYLTVAAPSALGPSALTAKNPIGTSNQINVTFTETSPPALVNSFWALTGSEYQWRFGAGPNDLWALNIAVGDPTTVPFLGFDFLLNTMQVASGVLSGAGLGSFGVQLVPSAIGLTFYSQVVTLDGGGGVAPPTNVTTAFVLL